MRCLSRNSVFSSGYWEGTRLWYLFSAALRDSEHSALVMPAAVPLLEADVNWLGPLLAYLAGWAFEQKINININESFWFSRGCSGSSARAVSFFLFVEGLCIPCFLFLRRCSGSSARAVSFLLIRGGLLHHLIKTQTRKILSPKIKFVRCFSCV